MKFLVDNQLPKALARWLTGSGHDAEHVLDRGQGQTDDREIWAEAIAEGRIVVSKDEDFFILATRPEDAGHLLSVAHRQLPGTGASHESRSIAPFHPSGIPIRTADRGTAVTLRRPKSADGLQIACGH